VEDSWKFLQELILTVYLTPKCMIKILVGENCMINKLLKSITERRFLLTSYRFIKYWYLYYIVRNKNIIKYHKWTRLDNDSKLRLDYPLSESSVVFDLGGYVGDFTQALSDKFNCNIYVFEPVTLFYSRMLLRFNQNSKIRIFNYGIGNSERTEKFHISENASSLFVRSNINTEQHIKIKNLTSDFMNSLEIKKIDLIKINVEGMEYEILEDLIERNLIGIFINIQVQFHVIGKYSQVDIDNIRKLLNKTHELSWRFEDIWESWNLRQG
jgi:FkbM family methyltransferase